MDRQLLCAECRIAIHDPFLLVTALFHFLFRADEPGEDVMVSLEIRVRIHAPVKDFDRVVEIEILVLRYVLFKRFAAVVTTFHL